MRSLPLTGSRAQLPWCAQALGWSLFPTGSSEPQHPTDPVELAEIPCGSQGHGDTTGAGVLAEDRKQWHTTLQEIFCFCLFFPKPAKPFKPQIRLLKESLILEKYYPGFLKHRFWSGFDIWTDIFRLSLINHLRCRVQNLMSSFSEKLQETKHMRSPILSALNRHLTKG